MKLIAWDFDGVLNKGFQGGFEAWQRGFEADLGVSAADFTAFVYHGGLADVLVGKRDVLDLLRDYVAAHDVPWSAEAVLDHWLAREAVLDDEVVGWARACAVPGVIATNNDARRAADMWQRLGFSGWVERIFASGPLGVRKPDAGFYAAIEAWCGLLPADILLIDDAEKNIVAAEARGWRVFHFTDATRAGLPEVLGISR